MHMEVECAEIKEEESNQFQDTLLDIKTEGNSQAIPSAIANDNNQKSDVLSLLGCEKGDNIINLQYSSSISLVPSFLRDHCPEFFNPRVVSIGPLHYEVGNLKGSEGWKRACMRALLDHISCSPLEMLAACLRKVNSSIHTIKACYFGIRPCISDHDLASMMVRDACFILHFFSLGIPENELLWAQICRDLLLLENQIPFFVLKDIFELTILKSKPSASLTEHIKPLLQVGHGHFFKEGIIIPKDLANTPHHRDHILSLLHKCYQPQCNMISKSHTAICNVVELEKAGVSFKPNQDVSWPLAIEIEWSRFAWFFWLWNKPTLRIPVMAIKYHSEMILRNIIAYEQTTSQAQYFTSYVTAINDLVDSSDDIAKLVESQVIINYLGSNEEAANMINSLCKNVELTTFYFTQWQKLDTYYNRYWPRNIASLRRRYFNNPWTIIALFATTILFALTITQTNFTINPRK